jgi:hypothetical protein
MMNGDKERGKLGCDGKCLLQMSGDNHYRVIDCPEDCKPVKCPNYLLCGQACPHWFLYCHSNRCNYCNESFGCDLTFIEKEQECCICFNSKPIFIRWGCIHELCIDCFRSNHGWIDSFLQGPTDGSRLKVHNEEDKKLIERIFEEYDRQHPREILLDENGWEIDNSPEIEIPKWIGQCPLCRHREIPKWRKKESEL